MKEDYKAGTLSTEAIENAEAFMAGLPHRTKPHMMGEAVEENEGVRRCNCEDAPCCGH